MPAKPRLIAAHHIALLLLSTAKVDSPEHHDIVELNGPGVWKALAELNLVERTVTSRLSPGPWLLSPRGQAYVATILSLPLPGASTPASSRKARLGRVLRAASAPGVQPQKRSRPVQNLQRPAATSGPEQLGAGIPPAADEDDGPPPPRAPNPKPIPDIVPAATHAERMQQAGQLADRGFGMNEIAETLELSVDEVEFRYFRT